MNAACDKPLQKPKNTLSNMVTAKYICQYNLIK